MNTGCVVIIAVVKVEIMNILNAALPASTMRLAAFDWPTITMTHVRLRWPQIVEGCVIPDILGVADASPVLIKSYV